MILLSGGGFYFMGANSHQKRTPNQSVYHA